MTNLLLFTANRHELWFNKVKSELAAGHNVIATRNYWSSLAFQGHAEGMDLSVIRAITATFTEDAYMHPDVGIILNFRNEQERQRRIAARGELSTPDTFESRPTEFQQRIIDGYDAIAHEEGLTLIDAGRSIDDIQADIRQLIGLA